jgi:hypothetical protein
MQMQHEVGLQIVALLFCIAEIISCIGACERPGPQHGFLFYLKLRKDLDTAGFIPCLHCTSFTTDLNPTRSPSHLNRESRWPCWCLLLDEVHGFSFDSVVGDLRQWFLVLANVPLIRLLYL